MSTIEIDVKMPQWAVLAQELQQEMPGMLAATLQTNRGLIFDSEGTHNGRPGWARLKCRKGQILSDRGDLRRSMAPQNDGLRPGTDENAVLRIPNTLDGDVTIGTKIAYGWVHNQGLVIRPTGKKPMSFMCGNRRIFARKVTIPARPFNDWTAQDDRELTETVDAYLTEKWEGQASAKD